MNYPLLNRLFSIFMMLVVSLLLATCEKEANDEPVVDACNDEDVRGELIETSYYLSVTPQDVQTILSGFGLAVGIQLHYTVDIFMMDYKTHDKNDVLTDVSGVVFVPRGLDTLDLLSVQHGTTFKRNNVGSVNPFYYALDGLV